MRTFSTYFAGEAFVHEENEDDPQIVAGDPYAELEESDCPCDPQGHLDHTHCGITRCVRCGRIAWL